MWFDTVNQQWFQYTGHTKFNFGTALIDELTHAGSKDIQVGTVMVFVRGEFTIIFQTLSKLDLFTVNGVSIVPYEPGSIIFVGKRMKGIPTLRFRDCRMPTRAEFDFYIEQKIV